MKYESVKIKNKTRKNKIGKNKLNAKQDQLIKNYIKILKKYNTFVTYLVKKKQIKLAEGFLKL